MDADDEKHVSVERFLKDLDPGFVRYAPFLQNLGFTSVNMLRFLKMKDLLKMPCALPAPHRRMILNGVFKLQSPETKLKTIESPDSEDMNVFKKMRNDESNAPCSSLTRDRSSNLEPRKLFVTKSKIAEQSKTATTNLSNTQSYSDESQDTVEEIMLNEKMELESACAKQKKELSDFTSVPCDLMPLALPGSGMMATTTCARCHHRGHRKDGNKKGANCQFETCLGFHYCGKEKLHPEFKIQKREKEKSIRALELQIKEKDEQISNLQEFNKKTSTNFIRNVRPRLQRLFPARYKGKDGNQRLLRDMRYLKISCKGRIPQETDNNKEELDELIRQGKNKVVDDTGVSPPTDNFLSDEILDSLSESDSVVDEPVYIRAKKPRVSATVTASTMPTTLANDSSYSSNQAVQGNTPIQHVPQAAFASAGLQTTTHPTQNNALGFGFDFHNPFMPQPYYNYYVPQTQHQQFIHPQYRPACTNSIGPRATTLQNTAGPQYFQHLGIPMPQENQTASLNELAEVALRNWQS